MHRILLSCIVLQFCLLLANSACANDGINFIIDPRISLLHQEIELSLSKVKVNYHYLNSAELPITQTLALKISGKNKPQIQVDGQDVDYQVATRAISDNGIDISAILQELGLSFEPILALQSIEASANRSYIVDRLKHFRALDLDGNPRWQRRHYAYWQQLFAANAKLQLSYNYQPHLLHKRLKIKGISDYLALPLNILRRLLLDNAKLKNIQSQIEKHNPQIQEFCPTISDYQQMALDNDMLNTLELHFNLAQPDNWASTIKSFRLQVQKPDDKLAMLCCRPNSADSNDSSCLNFEARNYVPPQDLKVLYLPKDNKIAS